MKAKDVYASYQSFKLSARINGKFVSAALASANGDVRWEDDAIPGQELRDAMETFASELGWGQKASRNVGSGWFSFGLDPSLPGGTNDVSPSDGVTVAKSHVMTKNLQSIRETTRFQDFLAEVDDVFFDMLCVTETWREEAKTIFHTSHGHCIFLSGGARSCGVGIF